MATTRRLLFVDETFVRRVEAIEQKLGNVRGSAVVANTPTEIIINADGSTTPPAPPAAAPPYIKVRLKNVADGTYRVYPWSDTEMEGDPIAAAAVPKWRPLGTEVDFVVYGETGFGYYDAAGAFVLVVAIEERYDSGPCVIPPPEE